MPTRTISPESQIKPGSVQVDQTVIDLINEMGMDAALRYARSGSAPPQFVEAVRRFYPDAVPEINEVQERIREAVRSVGAQSQGPGQQGSQGSQGSQGPPKAFTRQPLPPVEKGLRQPNTTGRIPPTSTSFGGEQFIEGEDIAPPMPPSPPAGGGGGFDMDMLASPPFNIEALVRQLIQRAPGFDTDMLATPPFNIEALLGQMPEMPRGAPPLPPAQGPGIGGPTTMPSGPVGGAPTEDPNSFMQLMLNGPPGLQTQGVSMEALMEAIARLMGMGGPPQFSPTPSRARPPTGAMIPTGSIASQELLQAPSGTADINQILLQHAKRNQGF